jgi:C1A family cysteine protease
MSKNEFSVEQLKAAIKERNAKWTPHETPLTRLTTTEQMARLGFLPTDVELRLVAELNLDKPDLKTHKVEFKVVHIEGAPTKMDWRNVNGQNYATPIRDQDGCGSCVAFGTIAALEALVKIKVAGAATATST